MRSTFASRVIEFYRHLKPPRLRGLDVEALYPYRDPAVMQVMSAFYGKFFSDTRKRVFIIGINPGRFGAGTTGVPFTDPVSLDRIEIENPFPKKRELSAVFIEAMIDRLGGFQAFYKSFFITAASPIGFTKGGKNYNYYDHPRLLAAVRPFIIESMRAQLGFGVLRHVAIVLGTGKNFAFLQRLNDEQRFFGKLLPVEHPRFIMQYRRPHMDRYLERYEALLRTCVRSTHAKQPDAGTA